MNVCIFAMYKSCVECSCTPESEYMRLRRNGKKLTSSTNAMLIV